MVTAAQCLGPSVILQMVPRYQNLLHGAELVESQLKESFSEYLNAEVALRTVSDVSMAIAWLKGSFFYIRVRPVCPETFWGRAVLRGGGGGRGGRAGLWGGSNTASTCASLMAL